MGFVLGIYIDHGRHGPCLQRESEQGTRILIRQVTLLFVIMSGNLEENANGCQSVNSHILIRK